MARRNRGNETVADMARSLGLVLGSVVLILLIGPTRELIFPTGPHGTAVKTVDAAAQVAAVRRMAAYPVLAPRGLSDRWRPTSARMTVAPAAGGSSAALHLGYVTPRGRYLALEEGDAPGFVVTELGREPRRLPTVDVAGSRWHQWRTASGELALSRTAEGRSVVLTGSAGLDELRELAGSLATG